MMMMGYLAKKKFEEDIFSRLVPYTNVMTDGRWRGKNNIALFHAWHALDVFHTTLQKITPSSSGRNLSFTEADRGLCLAITKRPH